MKHLVWLLSLLLCLAGSVKAQQKGDVTYAVKGVLVDSITGEGEAYSTIRIANKKLPKKIIATAVTDLQGSFYQSLSAPATYIISFSSVGRNTVFREFTLTPSRPVANLGTFCTTESTEMLKGVEVLAQKPIIKVDADKLEYSVKDDPDSKTNTLLEMLRKVPMVTVDGEDKIKVNGSGKFIVHLDGKPNMMMTNNPTLILKSIPASMVKTIEVIAEPGAKYDADGVGGILNIVTHAESGMQGYIANMNASVGTVDYSAGMYTTVQSGKLILTGNYSYNYIRPRKITSDAEREDFTSDLYKYLTSENYNEASGHSNMLMLEGSYELDSLNLLSLSIDGHKSNHKGIGTGSTWMQDQARNEMYSYGMDSRSDGSYSSISASVDYQHSFKHNKEKLLTFSYRFGNNPVSDHSSSNYVDMKNYPNSLFDNFYTDEKHSSEHTLQVDFLNPFDKKHRLGVGLKYILRENKSVSDYYDRQTGTDSYVRNEQQSDDYKHTQNILAGYAEYRYKYKKLTLKAGLRYEHTFMDVKYHTENAEDFDAGFDNLVPSASVAYNLTEHSNTRFAYNLRISRPNIFHLNPFVNNTNPEFMIYGNPGLETEKTHAFKVTYGSFAGKFNVDLQLKYMFTNNGIERYSFMKDGIQNSTFGNIAKSNNTELMMSVNWNMGPKTRLNCNASANYSDYQSDEMDIRNSGFSANLFLGFQQTLPAKVRFSLNVGANTPNIELQGRGNSFTFYSASLNRSFMKERLTFSLRASNFLKKDLSIRNSTETGTFRYISNARIPLRSFAFSVSYRIGELRAQVKKAARSISNDDVKSSGSSSPTQGQGQ